MTVEKSYNEIDYHQNKNRTILFFIESLSFNLLRSVLHLLSPSRLEVCRYCFCCCSAVPSMLSAMRPQSARRRWRRTKTTWKHGPITRSITHCIAGRRTQFPSDRTELLNFNLLDQNAIILLPLPTWCIVPLSTDSRRRRTTGHRRTIGLRGPFNGSAESSCGCWLTIAIFNVVTCRTIPHLCPFLLVCLHFGKMLSPRQPLRVFRVLTASSPLSKKNRKTPTLLLHTFDGHG